MELYVAVTHFDGGSNFYVDQTEDGLYGQVAAFCRSHWDDVTAHGGEDVADTDDRLCVEEYYSVLDEEGLDIGTAAVPTL